MNYLLGKNIDYFSIKLVSAFDNISLHVQTHKYMHMCMQDKEI